MRLADEDDEDEVLPTLDASGDDRCVSECAHVRSRLKSRVCVLVLGQGQVCCRSLVNVCDIFAQASVNEHPSSRREPSNLRHRPPTTLTPVQTSLLEILTSLRCCCCFAKLYLSICFLTAQPRRQFRLTSLVPVASHSNDSSVVGSTVTLKRFKVRMPRGLRRLNPARTIDPTSE